jgi:AcrR family transcriptional regulator
MASVDLSLRSTPQQARSRATMKLILKVSAELLEEVGVDGFNTNLLAERAGIGTRAIYRYFPNKLAILVAMVNDLRPAEHAWVGDLRRLGANGDWRAGAEQAIAGLFNAASRMPGYAALRAAVQATPELRELDRIDNKSYEADLAEGLRALGVTISEARMSAICRIILESCNAVLDIALQSPKEEAELLVNELKLMIISLIEKYIPA